MNRQFQNFKLMMSGHWPGFYSTEDGASFLQFVTDQNIQGLAYRLLESQKMAPAAVLESLGKSYYAILAANTAKLKYLEELEPILARAGVSMMIVKGAALLDHIYKDPGMRPMEDIDAVVHPANLPVVDDLLRGSGYVKDPAYALMYRNCEIVLDLHTDLMHTDRIAGRKYLGAFDTQRLLGRSLPWGPGFLYVRRCDDADHIIFLAHHMIKHSFSKLIWVVDAFKVLEDRDAGFWRQLEQKTAGYQQARAVACMLYLTEKMFGLKPPETAGLYQCHQILSAFEKAILNIRADGGHIGDLGNLLWMFCVPGFSNRLRFMGETLFPARPVLQREQPPASGRTSRNPYLRRTFTIFSRLPRNLILIISQLLHSPHR